MIEQTREGAVLTVRVIPRAAKSLVAGVRGGALLVRLKAPPVDGAANAALLDLLAATFGVPRRTLTILSGDRGRTKRVRLAGLGPADAAARLDAIRSNPAS